jgi:hypothetical protein
MVCVVGMRSRDPEVVRAVRDQGTEMCHGSPFKAVGRARAVAGASSEAAVVTSARRL